MNITIKFKDNLMNDALDIDKKTKPDKTLTDLKNELIDVMVNAGIEHLSRKAENDAHDTYVVPEKEKYKNIKEEN